MEPMRHPIPAVASPAGANASVVIYDDGRYDGTTKVYADSAAPGRNDISVVVACLLDQGCTLIHNWEPTTKPSGSSSFTASVSYTITASTFFRQVVPLFPGHNQITVKAGATPPTPAAIAAERNTFPGSIT